MHAHTTFPRLRPPLLRLSAAAALALAVAATAPAGSPRRAEAAPEAGAVPPLTAAEKAQGWRLLFDGKSPAGWRGYHQAGFPPAGWSIREGCLVDAQADGRPGHGGGDLMTTAAFTDFDFQFEWRISPGGNSGVYYFVDERQAKGPAMFNGDDGTAAVGHEYQLLDDDRHPDGKIATHTTASLYDIFAPVGKRLNPVGQFNQSRLLVSGNHVEHWLNGARVLSYELNSPAYQAAVAKSKFHLFPDFDTRRRSPLLMQDHGCEVWFRALKVRELRPG